MCKLPATLCITGMDAVVHLRPEYLGGRFLQWQHDIGAIDAPNLVPCGSTVRREGVAAGRRYSHISVAMSLRDCGTRI
jgi:hypothetical protein